LDGKLNITENCLDRNLKDKGNKPGSIKVIHCGGLSGELARDELFGHVKGAYTGANEHKSGIFLVP
jgi:two-component system response regulator HydG